MSSLNVYNLSLSRYGLTNIDATSSQFSDNQYQSESKMRGHIAKMSGFGRLLERSFL